CCGHGGRRREPGDAGVQRCPVLRNGSGVVAVKDLTLRPFGSPMAGGAVGLEDCRTGRDIAGLWLIERPHGGKDPQGLRVEGRTAPLSYTVVIDGGVRERRGPFGEALPRIKHIAG